MNYSTSISIMMCESTHSLPV